MLIYASKLIGTPILSVQAGSKIAEISEPIVDPDNLRIIAFKLSSPLLKNSQTNILDATSIREHSSLGLVIDDIDELVAPDDVIKIAKTLELNFNLVNLKVETKKGSKLGKVINYTVTTDDYTVQQIIVKRPLVKSFVDPELTISRNQIIEITDYKIIVKDEEKTIKARTAKEDFIPNFVNPFREQGFSPTGNQNLADKDTK